MEAVIVNFRGGRHTQVNNQMILKVSAIASKDKTSDLIGKTATWTSPAGKKLSGKITAAHGNSGAVRAIFNPGLPGQSIGSKVTIK